MTAENNPGESPSIEKLQEQIENLNKGIATYRDESQASKAAVVAANAKIKQLEDAIAAKKDDDTEVKLNSEDQKKLEAWAKAQGFVTKDEMEAQKTEIFNASLKSIESQAVDEFLKSHPQYDSDDEWIKVKEQFDLYKTPTSLAGYRQLLNKIYKELNPGDDGSAKARAEIEKKNRLGLGGGSQKGGDEGDDTIDRLLEKYPRLSRDQIIARKAELTALYKDKKK